MQLLLKAKDVIRKAITLEPHRTLYDARDTMLRYNISRIVVAKDNKPVGIITEKDIARFVYSDASGTRLDRISLAGVMSTNLITTDVESALNISAGLMLDNNISSLIVVGKDGDLKGIFTKTDLTSAYANHCAGNHLVKDFMTKKVISVSPDESLHNILLKMVNNLVSRIVVVSERQGEVLGIITGRDLLPVCSLIDPYFNEFVRKNYKIANDLTHKRKSAFMPSGIKAIFLASDIMRRDPITVAKDSDLADAAEIMIRNGISGLPVIDPFDTKNLVGIITKTDIVKALAASVIEEKK